MKEQIRKLLNLLEENESRGIKLTQLSRLWVLWNARELSADEVVVKVKDILKRETDMAWQDFVKGRPTIAEGEDPLAALFI